MIKKLFKILYNLLFRQKQTEKEVILKEAFKSKIALKNGIDNTTNDFEILECIYYTDEMFKEVEEILITKLGIKKEDIEKTSYYRCKELNKLVKGSKTSDHMKGKAIDFYVKGFTPQQVCKAINDDYLQYKQLIIYETKKITHISFDDFYFNCTSEFLTKTKDGVYKKN